MGYLLLQRLDTLSLGILLGDECEYGVNSDYWISTGTGNAW